jgi:hypothetical protein
VQFDKEEIVDLLRKEGKNEHVQKALQELPTRSITSSTRRCFNRNSGSTQANWPRKRSKKNSADGILAERENSARKGQGSAVASRTSR